MLVIACQEPQGPTETRVGIQFQMHNLTSMISTPPEESLQAHVPLETSIPLRLMSHQEGTPNSQLPVILIPGLQVALCHLKLTV